MEGRSPSDSARRLKAPVRKVAWEKVDEDEAVGLVEMQGRFNGEKYEHHLARSVTVAAPGIVTYADGERFGPLPLTVECAPGALTVLV